MTQNLENIYQTLLKHFGAQNWWPADTAFEVIVGAILTQNTSWKNVEKAINTIKEKGVISPELLYSLSEDELANLIKSSGFYNIKAKRLKNFLFFFKSFNFDLKKLQSFSNIREKLLGIKGIGKETADSILLYALELPYFVVDAYTKRIFHRLGYLKSENTDYDDVQHLFMNNLPNNTNVFKEYHALIVETAKKYCKKRPCCSMCPLDLSCTYSKTAKLKQKELLAEPVKMEY